ncbi:unnamed protein product [Orchesella dallaii]|uniref:Uncharacterized protein n=1 Tax=Orchesella dallaii TaxID=48710 RepID=A0ABP1QA77_9HEXA
MKSRRKMSLLVIVILQFFTTDVLSAENQTALPEPGKDEKSNILEDSPEIGKSAIQIPETIYQYVPVPMKPPPPKTIPGYYNSNPMTTYSPPPASVHMMAPPRYYNPYSVPIPVSQLTPADDRMFSKFAVVPPLIDKFPFNLWGPHGYYNLCTRTTPEDPVWSWGCAQAPYNVMGDVYQQQQQQQQLQQQPQQYQQPPPMLSQPYQNPNVHSYPYMGSLPAASSTYNTYTMPSSPDPNLNFLQQLANQYAQNPSTGYTSNGYYNYGGGTYAPVPNTGNFMSSAAYSSTPGRIYNYNMGHRGTLRSGSKSKKQKKMKAKPKVKPPVVKVEEEEEEVEEYLAEAEEE